MCFSQGVILSPHFRKHHPKQESSLCLVKLKEYSCEGDASSLLSSWLHARREPAKRKSRCMLSCRRHGADACRIHGTTSGKQTNGHGSAAESATPMVGFGFPFSKPQKGCPEERHTYKHRQRRACTHTHTHKHKHAKAQSNT